MRRTTIAATVMIGILLVGGAVRGDYDVKVDLENLSGEDKTDWPVVMRVCHVFGRSLPAGSLNPTGYHVYDQAGKEVPCAVEKVPPYDVQGNDELIFVVPKMKQGQKLRFRITNTAKESPALARVDVVNSPHNLIRNGGFEPTGGQGPAEWPAPAKLDTAVKRSGKSSNGIFSGSLVTK